MKRLPLIALGAALLLSTLPLLAQVAPPATPRARVSPHETISAVIAGTGMNAQDPTLRNVTSSRFKLAYSFCGGQVYRNIRHYY